MRSIGRPPPTNHGGGGGGGVAAANGGVNGELARERCGIFQMPLHYPRYTRVEYEAMPEWKLDCLLAEYGPLLQPGENNFERERERGGTWAGKLDSMADGMAPAPAPAPASDGTSVDQGIAYLLMLLALVLTYLIHPMDASSSFSSIFS
ncbi:hypothetical protein BUALT_Bualt01G0236500 [Buddleja alternifolia]|uniref:DUF7722 domain-containing protein n=1 Tax=Buddleja alternifolia TaxID=168488 RepID=A0AAV6YAI0_9LAMI|nr:hypothetical protein BUALT_Bualt01G0236500 [Buddleja alternifolia]